MFSAMVNATGATLPTPIPVAELLTNRFISTQVR
ncbi:hypothetical protein DFR69_106133 [Nocardia neocaledoniensis]|uniref:Uncharacterized protein n=1 Tax=Nocardia neocaledoniensis TaxID=236511 RepID=A0A317NGU9_9NOCA|nr:hypothetical protein DFR69_106133 [Nocardia neocaledoniensis]